MKSNGLQYYESIVYCTFVLQVHMHAAQSDHAFLNVDLARLVYFRRNQNTTKTISVSAPTTRPLSERLYQLYSTCFALISATTIFYNISSRHTDAC
jgi:hypothetical protein